MPLIDGGRIGQAEGNGDGPATRQDSLGKGDAVGDLVTDLVEVGL